MHQWRLLLVCKKTLHIFCRLTEYNFPAVLSRCKFPKTYDAIHELTTNRGKKRNPAPTIEGGEYSKSEARRLAVIGEIKNPNNRNRLLSEKLGITAFKIPDELWERHFPQFKVKIFNFFSIPTPKSFRFKCQSFKLCKVGSRLEVCRRGEYQSFVT